MKRYLAILSILVISVASCVKDRVQPISTGVTTTGDRTLIHYWTFNNGGDSTTLSVPTTTLVAGAKINFSFFQNGYADTVMPGSPDNLWNGATSGGALRVRNPYLSFVLHVPTTGYKNVQLRFGFEKSNKGPATNSISYTTDGVNYTTDGLSNTDLTITTSWQTTTIDFSSIAAANDNANFAIKFSNSIADTSGGNDRYDNISIHANTK